MLEKNWSTHKKLLLALGASGGGLAEYTATGNPLTFNTNVSKPLKSLLIPWTPSQSGSGDPSPENVRPISGQSGVTVYHSGADTSNPTTYNVTFPALTRNLFNEEYTDISTGVIRYEGLYVGDGTFTASTNMPKGLYDNLFFLAGDVSTGASSSTNGVNSNTSRTVTSVNGYVTIAYRIDSSDPSIDPRNYHVQIEKGDTVHAYEPYTNTCYGGSLDLVSGVLTVEWALDSLKGKDWYNYSGNRVFAWNAHKDKNTGIYSDCFPIKTNFDTDETILVYKNGASYATTIYFVKEGMTSAPDFRAWINALEYDPCIAYKLETPVTYQLTPTQITALVGDNTIWSDTNGSNTAVYYKRG